MTSALRHVSANTKTSRQQGVSSCSIISGAAVVQEVTSRVASVFPHTHSVNNMLTNAVPHPGVDIICTCMWILINTTMLYLLPISSISQVREMPEEAKLLFSSQLGASCSDKRPSADIPERSCWKRGGKSCVFWNPFNSVQSYLACLVCIQSWAHCVRVSLRVFSCFPTMHSLDTCFFTLILPDS